MSMAPYLVKSIAINKPKSLCSTMRTGNKNCSMAFKSTFVVRTLPTRHRHKVKDFNSVITCSLCHGYLVNATTIDNCLHSYCRSCIIKHLKKDKHCPQCRPSSKMINYMNLRPDKRLKSLVYKLVPGLYQREQERYLEFVLENQAVKEKEPFGNIATSDEDDDFFSPVEPISLSLEYHPKSMLIWHKQQIPSVRYLQCPAAVTVQHLKRFIASKFDIDMDNERVDIEIIYENEILPGNFSLMDVGYCYLWKRTAPMRFFYRILIHDLRSTNTSQVDLCDKALNDENCQYEATRKQKSKETDLRKSVRFQDSVNNDSSTDQKSNHVMKEAECTSVITDTDSFDDIFSKDTKLESSSPNCSTDAITLDKKLHRADSNKNSKERVHEIKKNKKTCSDGINYKLNNNYVIDPHCEANSINNNFCSQKHITIANNSHNTNKESCIYHTSNAREDDAASEKSDPKATIAKRKKTSEVSVKTHDASSMLKIGKKDHSHTEKHTDEQNVSQADQMKVTEPKLLFKSKDTSVKSSTPQAIYIHGDEMKKSGLGEGDPAKMLSEPLSPGNTRMKYDIFVSIPPRSQHFSIASESSLDNLPPSQLKTANRKNSKNSQEQQNYENHQKPSEKKKGSSAPYDDHKPDLPKLKIELSGMKTKFIVAKRHSDGTSSSTKARSPKHNSSNSTSKFTTENSVSKTEPTFKMSKNSVEAAIITNGPTADVDLATYAKNIGLKPIDVEKQEHTQAQHSSREAHDTIFDSKKTTDFVSSSIPTCIISASEIQCQNVSLHKKRKKEKHSKESRELGVNKKRRIHAEISSQNIDKSLKLKVKITANHKLHKTEKKANTDTDSNAVPTTPPVTIPTSRSAGSYLRAIKPSSTCSSAAQKPIPYSTETDSNMNAAENSTEVKIAAPLVTSGSKEPISAKLDETTVITNAEAGITRTPPILNKVENDKETSKKASSWNDKSQENRALPRMPRIKHTLHMSNPTRFFSEEQSKQFSRLIKQGAYNRMRHSSMISISEMYSAPRLDSIATVPSKSVNYTLITSSNPIITPAIDSSSPTCVVTPGISLSQLPQSQRVRFLHDAKISPSPPLPPSLFKTAPMQMQCPVRSNPVQLNKSKPSSQIEHRMAFPGDLLVEVKAANGRFPVPSHPTVVPKSIQSNFHGTGIIATNANSNNILKRPTHDNLATFAKQPKADQDRPTKTPCLSAIKVKTSGTHTSTVYDKLANSQLVPFNHTHFANNNLSTTHTQALHDRKQTTVVIPTCSVSVTKKTDISSGNGKNTDIRSEPNKRPAFEIVRIHSNIPPVDKQILTVTANNTIKQNHLKVVRPPPPPIPLVKIKRSVPQSPNATNDATKIEVENGNTMLTVHNKKESPPAYGIRNLHNELIIDSAMDVKSSFTGQNDKDIPASNNFISPPPPAHGIRNLHNELIIDSAKDVKNSLTGQNDKDIAASNNFISPPNGSETVTSEKSEAINDDTTSPVCDKIGALDLSGKSSGSSSVENTVLLNTHLSTPTLLFDEDQDQKCNNSKTTLQNAKVEVSASSKIELHIEKQVNVECLTSSPPQELLKPQLPSIVEKSIASTKTSFELEQEVVATFRTCKTSPKIAQTPSECPDIKLKISSKSPQDISQDSMQKGSFETRSDPAMTKNEFISFSTPSSYTSLYSSNNLQNLKMLSESAITREKLAVKNLRQVPMLSKLNDKIRHTSTVRQQNASVRNIPNPSALVLRNCPSVPLVATPSKSSSLNEPKPAEKNSVTSDISPNKKNGANESKDNRSPSKMPAQYQQNIPKIDLTLTSPCESPIAFSSLEHEKKPVQLRLPNEEIRVDPSPSSKETVAVSYTSDSTTVPISSSSLDSNSIRAAPKNTLVVSGTSSMMPPDSDENNEAVSKSSSVAVATSEKNTEAVH